MKTLTDSPLEEALERSLSFPAYLDMHRQLVKAGKTTGPSQSEAYIHFTSINLRRLERTYGKMPLLPELRQAVEAIDQPQVWVVLTEAWCGDAAQIVGYIAQAAEASDKVELRLALRDENPELMDQHLTNGGRSIPKLLILDAETHSQLAEWGPRPQVLTDRLMDWKDKQDKSKGELTDEFQLWYAKDKGNTTMAELKEVLAQTASS